MSEVSTLPDLEPPPVEWDSERADERAQQATRWLATLYPECAGASALDPYREAVYEAALGEDMAGYEEALRGLMRAGRSVALGRRS